MRVAARTYEMIIATRLRQGRGRVSAFRQNTGEHFAPMKQGRYTSAVPPWLPGAAFVASGYLIGSVLFGLIAASRAGLDLRGTGSGNVGATNVGRVVGKGTGRIVLLLDALKGLVPTLGAHLLLGRTDPFTAATGFAASFGHCYPLWYRFKGGKAAATSAGVLLAVTPWAGAAAATSFVVVKKLSKRASVGSLFASAIAVPIVGLLDGWQSAPFVLAVALFVLIVWRHRDNIGRLARGEEPPS